MKPYGSKWATIKYPGSTKPHGRECGICYPDDKISVVKSRARQEEREILKEIGFDQNQEEEMYDNDEDTYEDSDDRLESIREDAYAIISDKVDVIHALLKECQDLAKESGVTFYLNLGQSNYYDGELGYWQNSSSNC